MGEYSEALTGTSAALAPTKMSEGMKRLYTYVTSPVVSGDEDLFLSRRQIWGPLSSSCNSDNYGVWQYVQFDTARSGRIIERYFDCDTSVDIVSIESRFNLNIENRLSTSPLSFNVRLDVTSSVLHVLNSQGAQLVNDLWMCDITNASAGQVVSILGLEPLYHCSLFTQGTIYSKLEMADHNTARLGFPKFDGGLGSSSADRAHDPINMVSFNL